jgi:hypothetical protein
METQDTESAGRRRLKPLEWAAGSVLIVAVSAIVVVFFTVKVCDQQLTSAGSVVEVCRHPQATDPPIVVLGAVILAFLGVFFSEISGFGFTLKRTVEEAKRTAQAAVLEVRQTTQDIRETAADLGEGVREALSQAQPSAHATLPEETDPVKQLAARYNEIRWTMPSGAARTDEMTALTHEMIALMREARGFDVESHLRSDDRGLRLAAVAYLYANPDPAWARQLADAAVSEDKPFNEYWALNALRKVLRGHCEALDDATRDRLQQRKAQLTPGTDRAQQIDQLLRDCPQRRGTTTTR